MKTWVIIIGILIVVFFTIGYLNDQGYLDVKWTTLAMIFAVLSGPYKFIKGMFSGSKHKITKILDQNKADVAEEKIHRKVYDEKILEKEEKIQMLEKEIALLDTKLVEIEQKKQKIESEVNAMDSNEIQDSFNDLYGEK